MSCKAFREVINATLVGDALESALGFAAFLQADDDFSAERCEGADGWNIFRKGINSAYVALDVDRNGLDIVLHINTYDGEERVDEALKEFTWSHLLVCPQGCGSTTLCGESKINNEVFGREYERICQSPLYFRSPGADDMGMIQRLLLLLR